MGDSTAPSSVRREFKPETRRPPDFQEGSRERSLSRLDDG
jgi:hypothetical protein